MRSRCWPSRWSSFWTSSGTAGAGCWWPRLRTLRVIVPVAILTTRRTLRPFLSVLDASLVWGTTLSTSLALSFTTTFAFGVVVSSGLLAFCCLLFGFPARSVGISQVFHLIGFFFVFPPFIIFPAFIVFVIPFLGIFRSKVAHQDFFLKVLLIGILFIRILRIIRVLSICHMCLMATAGSTGSSVWPAVTSAALVWLPRHKLRPLWCIWLLLIHMHMLTAKPEDLLNRSTLVLTSCREEDIHPLPTSEARPAQKPLCETAIWNRRSFVLFEVFLPQPLQCGNVCRHTGARSSPIAQIGLLLFFKPLVTARSIAVFQQLENSSKSPRFLNLFHFQLVQDLTGFSFTAQVYEQCQLVVFEPVQCPLGLQSSLPIPVMGPAPFEGLNSDLAQAGLQAIALLLLRLLLKQPTDLRGLHRRPWSLWRCLASTTASGSAKCSRWAWHLLLFRQRLIGVIAAMMTSVTAVIVIIIITTSTSGRCRLWPLTWWWPLFLWWPPIAVFILPPISIAILAISSTAITVTALPTIISTTAISLSSLTTRLWERPVCLLFITPFTAAPIPIWVLFSPFSATLTTSPSSWRIFLIIGLIFDSLLSLHLLASLFNLLPGRLCRLRWWLLSPLWLLTWRCHRRRGDWWGLFISLPTPRVWPLPPLAITGLLPKSCTFILRPSLGPIHALVRLRAVTCFPSAWQHYSGRSRCRSCWRGRGTPLEIFGLPPVLVFGLFALLSFSFSFPLSTLLTFSTAFSFWSLGCIGPLAAFAGITLSFGRLPALATLRNILLLPTIPAPIFFLIFFHGNILVGVLVDLRFYLIRTSRRRSTSRSLIAIIRFGWDQGLRHWDLSRFGLLRSIRNLRLRLSRLLGLRRGCHRGRCPWWCRLSRISRILLLRGYNLPRSTLLSLGFARHRGSATNVEYTVVKTKKTTRCNRSKPRCNLLQQKQSLGQTADDYHSCKKWNMYAHVTT